MNKLAPIFAVAAVITGGCGSTRSDRTAAAGVVDRLMQMDRTITGFRAKVEVSTYDMAGNKIAPDKSGYRLYVKPDMSLVCVSAPGGALEVASEIRTILRTKIGGVSETLTLPDSYFLRDIRSMLKFPLQLGPAAGAAPQPDFALEPEPEAGAQAATVRTLSMTYTGYEKAVLKVDTELGAVLEKTVYGADNSVKSRERHSQFVAINGGYLPGHTEYEWAGRRAVVHLWDYRAEEPPPTAYFERAEASCGALAASYGAALPVEAHLREPKGAAGR
jgi:hypothetical protein